MIHNKFSILGIGTGLAAFFAPMKFVFLVILVIIFADLISGIWSSRIRNVPCSSRKLRKSIKKMLGYATVIMLFFMIEEAFDFEIGSYRFVGGFICAIEMISILENIAVISENPIFIKIITLFRGRAKDFYGDVAEDIFNEKNKEK